jgi:hypothetical protein
MKFLPRCPKCDSTATELYQDRSVSSRMGLPFNAVFHCRTCGMMLTGTGAVGHVQREQVRHEGLEESRREEAAELARVLRERAEQVRRDKRVELERQEAARDKKRKRDREYKRSLRALRASSSTCSLESCGNSAGATSKYCSRACSNKNARARHASRLVGRAT